ncbi:bifunctional 3,4-dihydroxy-2-butanone-4-phosphate synthase/GTP cyclohydrolase II [Paenibacillus sp. N1-5-1-14]|uniref:bifunctional 3,4-dihydroxy-2-butanone-4-phosphate synthase/GTP cyclohydrolase II n=1 Tax=Paenibacillus radicibacter TaxID=2972488 RepID=UPI002158AC08|nr:bifunctional 3,4-dihydroxy-2-butanone-4-phosphate synthase/GTP cyclohydrolase II [Paenibacillus radicibacter]MCR8642348.1 bifunctional 3,4-dihydroxy-2-butanone-4-phosphate synthase/GTP cyclohydrolase II [Paenibacillus radicibacter]
MTNHQFSTVEDALEDLKLGKVIIVVDDEDRENEGDFIALSDKATPEVINFMITEGRGLVCVPITEERAQELDLPPMVAQNTDNHGTAFTVSIDHVNTTTGISAHERSETIKALISADAKSSDFRRPGHIFPLVAKKGGVLQRAGHTEAAVDLGRMCGSYPSAVICEIINEDGTMARVPQLMEISQKHDLKIITIQAMIEYRKHQENLIHREIDIQLPTDFGTFRAIAYTNEVDDKEHVALVKGDIDSNVPTLVRVHSECLTGDVFHSHRCDCGPQLAAALKQIDDAGSGVLLYMRQEGRGIGLINKMKAYALQEQGFDTVEANNKLGFAADLRNYGIGAQILKDLGVQKMRLMTNNPRKIKGLEGHGLEVTERVAIQMDENEDNRKYLRTKKQKLGHMLTFND